MFSSKGYKTGRAPFPFCRVMDPVSPSIFQGEAADQPGPALIYRAVRVLS
jgi:hypothetical protein